MKKFLFGTLAFASFIALFGLALIPVSLSIAKDVAVACIACTVILSLAPGRTARLFFAAFCAWVVVRYIGWRIESLPLDGSLVTNTATILLLAAEIYGVAMLLLGFFVNSWLLDREAPPLPKNPADYPTVDIYIPTYSENLNIVAPTVMGALEIDYPKDKFKVYVLDDGFPRSKNPKTMPLQAAELAQRTRELQELCERHGATWLGRDSNEHAKSGNLNAAMKKSTGDLLLILDADHIPARDILKKTVGFFRDPGMAFVQTPHFFVNADPIEKNLSLFNRMPAENDMFYRVVQKGLDLWNTSFFCGSAALINRRAIEDVGGFSVSSITEDASTSVTLHQKGWRSAYLGVPMIAGLQPETFASFVVQRLRWAMGMTQILVKQNPCLVRGLRIPQRFCYLSVSLFWLFPFARLMFFVAPLLSLFFNMTVYPVGLHPFMAYTVPYLIAGIVSFERFFGKVRRILLSEIYETLQSFYMLPALLSTLLNPSAPVFRVTPKGERLDKEHISSLNQPFYVALAVTIVGLGWGLIRMVLEPDARSALALSVAWVTVNSILLLGALGVILERPQRRSRPRIKMNLSVTAQGEFGTRKVALVDMTEKTVRIRTIDGESLESPSLVLEGLTFPTEPVTNRVTTLAPGEQVLRLKFPTPAHERAALAFAYGSSERWVEIWKSREASSNFVLSGLGVMVICIRAGLRHVQKLMATE